MVQGATCVIVNEDGEHQTFLPWVPHWSFYGAVQEDANTLWLCDRMSRIVRFSIRTGKFESFDTGAPDAHVGRGMVFDPATKKLFTSGYSSLQNVAVSFDTQRKRTVQLHQGFKGAHSMCFSFTNGDGTWSIIMATPGQSLLRWDPKRETVESRRLTDDVLMHAPLTSRLISDNRGRWYVPTLGWFDPRTGRIKRRGPRPEREMTWFARRGNTAFGAEDREGAISIHSWDMTTGKLCHLCNVPDAQVHGCNLTRSGKIVAVNVYGVFYRFDASSGALELSKTLPTDAVSYVDCLRRIGKDRLLGTTYITQRFWELDLKTGQGMDCGRAAPEWGEVAETWQIAGKVYMAVYIGGELVEYDPNRPPRYPENPCVVAKPPRGQRPTAAADDGRLIFYACTRPYPELGSVITRYDTKTGLAAFSEDPLPVQGVTGMAYLKRSNSLLCGTTMHADAKYGTPSTDRCYLARLSADTMKLEQKAFAPKGTEAVAVVGPLGRGKWLCTFSGFDKVKWAAVDTHKIVELRPNDLEDLPDGAQGIQTAGKSGLFVLRQSDRIELWDMRRQQLVKILIKGIDNDEFYVSNVFVQDGSVHVVTPWEIVVLENAL